MGSDTASAVKSCGPTGDETECACGCTAYDERCVYYLRTSEHTDRQVRPEHTCCKIPGRETTT